MATSLKPVAMFFFQYFLPLVSNTLSNMKKLIFLMFFGITNSAFCQFPADKTKFILTGQDRKDYVLNVDQHKITKVRDTTFGARKISSYVIAQVKLLNLSSDTLTYINMTCSTYDIFTVDNKKISIMGWDCDKNFPKEFKIAPHKNSTFNFVLYFDKNHPAQKFRFGIYLIRSKTKYFGFDILDRFWKSKVPFKNCLIWSNEVTIPKP
jgi:hypothetical protein